MAKGFAKGLVTGVAGTVAALAGAVYAFKKKVIEPEEQKAAFIEETVKSSSSPRITLRNKRSWDLLSQLLFSILLNS